MKDDLTDFSVMMFFFLETKIVRKLRKIYKGVRPL